MEAHLQAEEGPSAGAILVLAVGETKTLGRGPGANLRLDDPALEPRHAAARLTERGLEVVDLGGAAGTHVGDRRLPPRVPTPVDSGDLLRLGAHTVRTTLVGARGLTRRAAALPFPAAEFTHVERIGAGATGKVYRARWVPHGVDVALKLLRDEYGPGTPEHARFLRECGAVARLRCPWVIAVHDVRTRPDGCYTIMELVAGLALDVALARGPLEVPAALRVLEDVARALDVAGRAGVVHRDVKPANVLLDGRARLARLCDFGLAKDLASTLRTLTAQGVGLGTLAYLPPEQVSEAARVTPAADVYALGATLFHALAGRTPFTIDAEDQLEAMLGRPAPPLAHARPDAPPEVGALVAAMLAKDPAARPPAGVVADALRRSREARYPGWSADAFFAAVAAAATQAPRPG